MTKAVAISGNWRNDFFRRACKYYTDKFSGYDLFLCSNDKNNELKQLQERYGSVKGISVLKENRGFHVGAIDVINGALELAHTYDQVLSVHCDVIVFQDFAERTFGILELEGKLLAGSRLSYGNLGICTECAFINMKLGQSLGFLPIKSASYEAEACLKDHAFSFGEKQFINLMTRASYGYFPEIGMLHLHKPQTDVDSSVLSKIGLEEYAVSNFQSL
jgi:hypothetical protein